MPPSDSASITISDGVSDDVLGARPVDGTVLDQLLHFIEVVRSDSLWERQVRRDVVRNTELLQLEVWIWSDDRPRGKVNTLAHQIASQSKKNKIVLKYLKLKSFER